MPFGFAGNNSIHLIDAEKNNAAHVSATEGTIHQQSVTREVSAELQASDLQAVQSLTQLGDLDRQRTAWKPSRDLTAILIAGLSVLTVAAKMRQAIHSANIVATDCSPERIDGLSALPHIGRWVNLA